jgi:RNA polymerase sigma factor (sigma-70 family)
MFPICVVGGCHNLEFDVTPQNIIKGLREEGLRYFSVKTAPFGSFWKYTWIPECWGWKLTRMSSGGSIATIGCTGLGMTKEDKLSFSGAGDYLEPTFFHEYGVNGTTILGRVWGNTITDYYRAQPKVQMVDIDEAIETPSRDPEPQEVAEVNEEKQFLRRCIAKLPEDEQEIVRLKFAMEMTNREIARTTGLSESNVGIKLYRIIRKLRSSFQET